MDVETLDEEDNNELSPKLQTDGHQSNIPLNRRSSQILDSEET